MGLPHSLPCCQASVIAYVHMTCSWPGFPTVAREPLGMEGHMPPPHFGKWLGTGAHKRSRKTNHRQVNDEMKYVCRCHRPRLPAGRLFHSVTASRLQDDLCKHSVLNRLELSHHDVATPPSLPLLTQQQSIMTWLHHPVYLYLPSSRVS